MSFGCQRTTPMLAVLASVLLGAACGDDAASTKAVIVVTSDLDVPGDIDTISIEVTGPEETRRAVADLGPPDGRALPRHLELHHTGGPLGPYPVRVVGLSGDSEVVEETVLLTFRTAETIRIAVHLEAACVGVTCGVGEVCTTGSCGDPPDAGEPMVEDAGADAGELADGGVDSGTDAGEDAGACTPGAETCNARDDDCDGTIDERASCPCPVRRRGTRAYMFCDMQLTWDDAQTACRANGYDLVVINGGPEDSFVWSNASSFAARRWFIGLTDSELEGTFVWVDGSPLGYRNWEPGQPNDSSGGQDCVAMSEDMGGMWVDRSCDVTARFVCEIP